MTLKLLTLQQRGQEEFIGVDREVRIPGVTGSASQSCRVWVGQESWILDPPHLPQTHRTSVDGLPISVDKKYVMNLILSWSLLSTSILRRKDINALKMCFFLSRYSSG